MREPLMFALYKIEKELVGNHHLNQKVDIALAIKRLEIILEKAKICYHSH